MKVGDKVVTRFGTGFVISVAEGEYLLVQLDGGLTQAFMIDDVWRVT